MFPKQGETTKATMSAPPTCTRLAAGLRLLAVFWIAAALTAFQSLAGESPARPADPLRSVTEESRSIEDRIADVEPALTRASAELAALRRSRVELEEMVQRLERRAEVQSLGREFAKTLVEQVRGLPRPGHYEPARSARTRQLAVVSDDNIRIERQLDALSSLDVEATRHLAGAQPSISGDAREKVRADLLIALAHQEGLLRQLSEGQNKLIAVLRETDAAERGLEASGRGARVRLTQLLYWIPAPPSTDTLSQILPSLQWTVSPANWSAAGKALSKAWSSEPWWPALALIAAAGLAASRGRLRRALVALAPSTLGHERYRIAHAFQAIAITFGLSAPIPIALWTMATMLGASMGDDPFPHALAMALGAIARLLLSLFAFVWLLDRDGLAVRHFGKDPVGYDFAARMIRRFAWIIVPLMFLAALNGLDFAPFANRQSLGRACFSLAMMATAALFWIVLRRRSPFMQPLIAGAPRGMATGLHPLWHAALVAAPLAIGVLAAVGYFVVAAYFWGHVLLSLFIVLAAAMLYGLMALWVQVQDSRLAPRKDEESRRQAQARAEEATDGAIAGTAAPGLDIASIGEQTRSLLDLFVTASLLAMLWWVWKDAVPMLSKVGDYPLWSSTSIVDGKAVAHHVAVNSLLLALMSAAVAAIAVRNVGALLDIVLLRRIDMQADANYAIKVTTRYAIAAAGILLVASVLGIGWSDVQWLVAALGVGLGFGLQEIVANFVSGLIILAERPIRIGDMITVGGVSGRVTSIRARATIIVDPDNKEVLIPNKAFITERVVNWTYSDETTRIVIKFSVPRGADVVAAERAVIEAIGRIPDVLREPGPSVYVTGFRDAHLDLEIRAFVDKLGKQMRVQHEISLAVDRVLHDLGAATVPLQNKAAAPDAQPGRDGRGRSPGLQEDIQ